ncbi:unnamed protein product, partial [Chrysoparadoxa australica]
MHPSLHLAGLLILMLAVVAASVAEEVIDLDMEPLPCLLEYDLNGTTCQVSDLPSEELIRMLYARGYDGEGAERAILVEAVQELLDYEAALERGEVYEEEEGEGVEEGETGDGFV